MFHIVLYEPEIPPNTGNIIRLCANTGATLHLIHPLGFELDDKKLRRAGLDYKEYADIREFHCFDDFLDKIKPDRLFAISTKGNTPYTDVGYRENDAFLFGPETRGLPQPLRKGLPEQNILRIPMQSDSRSLNLSNAVAIILYEAWRQNHFA